MLKKVVCGRHFRTVLYSRDYEVAARDMLPGLSVGVFRYCDLPAEHRPKIFNLLHLLFPFLAKRFLLTLIRTENSYINVVYTRKRNNRYNLRISLERVARPVKPLGDYHILELVEKAEI